MNRRELIAAGAVGGAVAWVAPVVLSSAAAAQGSVGPGANLLMNGSFEDGPVGFSAPSWSFAT